MTVSMSLRLRRVPLASVGKEATATTSVNPSGRTVSDDLILRVISGKFAFTPCRRLSRD